jgi:hypothetical protein
MFSHFSMNHFKILTTFEILKKSNSTMFKIWKIFKTKQFWHLNFFKT